MKLERFHSDERSENMRPAKLWPVDTIHETSGTAWLLYNTVNIIGNFVRKIEMSKIIYFFFSPSCKSQ